MNDNERVFYIILILCNTLITLQYSLTTQTASGFACNERKQTLITAWLIVMTRFDMKETGESLTKRQGNEFPMSTTNGPMLRAGVNNIFLLHSFSIQRMWRQYSSYALLLLWRVCICILHNKSLHSHSAGATSSSSSSVFNMLFTYLTPRRLYNNSVLWRNVAHR